MLSSYLWLGSAIVRLVHTLFTLHLLTEVKRFVDVCVSDTENDDTVLSTRSQRSAAVAAVAVVQQLDDIIDDDSDDFQVSAKPRANTRATRSQDAAKYCTSVI